MTDNENAQKVPEGVAKHLKDATLQSLPSGTITVHGRGNPGKEYTLNARKAVEDLGMQEVTTIATNLQQQGIKYQVRALTVYAMRQEGLPWQAAGEVVYVSPSTARNYVEAALRAQTPPRPTGGRGTSAAQAAMPLGGSQGVKQHASGGNVTESTEDRCTATTKAGTRCKNAADCHVHRDAA